MEIQRFLKVSPHSFAFSHVASVAEGLNYLKNRKHDLILLDAAMLKESNFFMFKHEKAKENIPVIMLSELNEQDSKRQAEIAGAADYMAKNEINLFHLQKTIMTVLKLNET